MGKKRKKAVEPTPAELKAIFEQFYEQGGMRAIEERALRETRALWLEFMEAVAKAYADDASEDGWFARMEIGREIRSLRHHLGIKQTLEQRRAKTLARVRKHRAAKKAAPSAA